MLHGHKVLPAILHKFTFSLNLKSRVECKFLIFKCKRFLLILNNRSKLILHYINATINFELSYLTPPPLINNYGSFHSRWSIKVKISETFLLLILDSDWLSGVNSGPMGGRYFISGNKSILIYYIPIQCNSKQSQSQASREV